MLSLTYGSRGRKERNLEVLSWLIELDPPRLAALWKRKQTLQESIFLRGHSDAHYLVVKCGSVAVSDSEL